MADGDSVKFLFWIGIQKPVEEYFHFITHDILLRGHQVAGPFEPPSADGVLRKVSITLYHRQCFDGPMGGRLQTYLSGRLSYTSSARAV